MMRQAGRYQPSYRAVRQNVGFLELCLREFPDGAYGWLVEASIGDAEAALGQAALAAASYRRSLAIQPDNAEVQAKIEGLGAQ